MIQMDVGIWGCSMKILVLLILLSGCVTHPTDKFETIEGEQRLDSLNKRLCEERNGKWIAEKKGWAWTESARCLLSER